MKYLDRWWKENPDDLHREALVCNTMGNVNLSMYGREVLRVVLLGEDPATLDEEIRLDLGRIKAEIRAKGERCAFAYAAFVKAINDIHLVATCYPEALRVRLLIFFFL
jgi:predicted nucleic acid-binding protein